MLNNVLGDVEISTFMLAVMVLVVAFSTLILYQSFTGKKLEVKARRSSKAAAVDARLESVQLSDIMRGMGAPEGIHEEASMIPCQGLFVNNTAEPYQFENDFCTGKFLSLHRPTHDAKLNKACKYPYGDYFKGKKRLWECRMQFQFKEIPKISDLYFGVESEAYVPLNKPTKMALKNVVSLLKGAVGDQIYHTPGDDPSVVSGELEVPAFVMPLLAFDQFIVTPAGQEPPKLTDPNIASMGSHRSKRVKQYQKEIESLVFEPGGTYTFCFWGISQWLDKLNWTVKLPLANLDFNLFCGQPPVHVVVYTLRKVEGEDQRRLQWRKNYYLNVAFWSSQYRPGLGRIKALFGDYSEKYIKQSWASCLQSIGKPDHKRTPEQAQPRSMLACCIGR